MSLYWTANAVMPTTGQQVLVATGTTTKTMLQVATPATNTLQVVAFGVEFATALTAACTVELVDTAAIAATVTAHVAAGVQPYDASASGGASIMTLGTAATGYTASAEGSIVATRTGKSKVLPIGASSYEWEWSLGREFFVPVSHFLRVRLTTATTVNAYTWILWSE